jgi:hypothetical protein
VKFGEPVLTDAARGANLMHELASTDAITAWRADRGPVRGRNADFIADVMRTLRLSVPQLHLHTN